MKVKLTKDSERCRCFGHKLQYSAGETVNAIPASNLPGGDRDGRLWVDEPDTDMCYGVLLEPDDYEIVAE